MTTLGEARSRLRLWLEDPMPDGLWSDEELDEGLRQSLSTYGMLTPLEATATLTAADGDAALGLPAGARNIVRVTGPGGYVLPRRDLPERAGAGEELAWERWGDQLLFSRPLAAGNYAVRYHGPRLLPADDAGDVPIPDADLSLLVAGAALWAIEARSRQEWKRGPLPPRYEGRRLAAREDYHDLLAAFHRRVRSRRLESAQ
ncbi:MAG TPA: hypothetical protein VFN57_07900 [Thermomicrobiaceae bacterium]|nr:hypothetical protein [Thermomicrobiaceae bacterium]